MKNKIFEVISILSIFIAILLMIFANGIEMTFAPSPDRRVVELYSYTNSIVFGYGNWFAPITVISSVATLVLKLFEVLQNENSKATQIFMLITTISSIFVIVVFKSFNLVSMVIFILLFIATILHYLKHSR